ncbi:F-box/RNI/FBD-like domains-containing protein, putative isoform 1 [Hibiscus syriacus]|uniref:F-box/RNI/FBD-like domains-containing protein, putative isoform 1 n=1 Tax=Hibiscus syriacus TaxID=106335 RepID=A0A6A2YKI8_HIBSY|nr:F-box/RNI/FBD-like domains-containing protein, putative isoform 1 [Hibiscus syriacus]
MANSAIQEINVSSKIRRSSDEEVRIDGISRLPDVLIQHILSFLSTKEAMATSILSKRWLPVWTSVPVIDLQDSPSCRTDSSLRLRFEHFVTRVLILNKMACLDKFCLKFNMVDRPSCVETWFWDAVSRDVKELDITIHGTQSFPFLKLPFIVFTAKTMQVLKLSNGVELHVTGTVSLPCLKVLHLVWIKYSSNESVSRLFAGCHVLQELVLRKYVSDNTSISDVSIQTLKILSIRFATGRRKHQLKINAPILEYLNLEDNLGLEFDLEDVSSLVEANVSVTWLENRHIPLLKALCNAKFVSLHWDWHSKMTWHNFRPHRLFRNLVRLELSVGYGGWNMLSLFLEISDNLQVLVLTKNDNCRGLGLECRWKPQKNVPECLLSSLERVEFKGYEEVAYQLRMVKYILKNARVLKMMDICTNGDLPLESKVDVLKKLLMFTSVAVDSVDMKVHGTDLTMLEISI